jgi:exopolysaccharide biosynthesis WecB/TagA/CpsF family protein
VEFRFDADVISVNVPSRAALLREADARLRACSGFAIATINLDHLAKLAVDRGYRKAYGSHELIVADGNPVVWLAQLARRPVELVPGSDLVLPLARLAAAAGVSIAILGSTRGALERAAAELQREVPGLSVAALIAPPYGFNPVGPDAAAMLERIAESGAGLCFVALGAPKQEMLAALGRSIAPHVGFASVGAGIDFIAGHQSRAPNWMRKLAMEWVWRMVNDPRRLVPRYLRCAMILPSQVAAAWALRRASPQG